MPSPKGKQLISFWRLQALGWSALFALVCLAAVPHNTLAGFINGCLSVLFLFGTSCLLRSVCRALLKKPRGWLALEAYAFGWSVLAGVVSSLLFCEIVIWRFGPADLAEFSGDSVNFSVVLFLWCSLYLSIKLWQQASADRERLFQAETQVRDALIAALRYQLNPHFLFNSLNAVSTLVLQGRSTEATRMLSLIGDLLRTTLDTDIKAEIPLSQELAFTRRYLDIERVRFGDRLRIDFEVPPETLDALVPCMLLQPLVENAVRHGIAHQVDGGSVSINAARQGDKLELDVRNSGSGAAGPESAHPDGVGLRNVRERLHTLYGTAQSLRLEWPETGGCRAVVALPLKTALPATREQPSAR